MLEKVTIPAGVSGAWKIDHVTVTAEEAKWEALRAMRTGRMVPAGTYTRLRRGHTTVMSDTPDEMRDHREPVMRATGSVLINGLGLGVVLRAILKKPEVTDVTVIEASEDVLGLVQPHYSDPRLTIVKSDAFTWTPPKGKRYQVVWHDIWDHITPDNLPQMTKLKRKYGRRADWQGCWAEWQCRRHARS